MAPSAARPGCSMLPLPVPRCMDHTRRSSPRCGAKLAMKGGLALTLIAAPSLSRTLGAAFSGTSPSSWLGHPDTPSRHFLATGGVTGGAAAAAAPRQAASAAAAWRGGAAAASLGAVLVVCGRRSLHLRLRSVRVFSTQAAAKAQAAVLETVETSNFVEDIVAKDSSKGTYSGRVCTRFPPEPNGYLHIGHAKSICLNFGIARKFSGTCNLRFDDTNPASEKQEYIDSIKEDVRWLGFEWDGPAHYASDYFGKLYEWAKMFVEKDWAYIDELTAEEISEYRGSLTRPGKDSPYRNRPIEESLALLEKMRAGEVEAGKAVLRAKIDMAHNNVIMRDPIMYRIVKDTPHPRTGTDWPIYPSYDWAHGLSDAIEQVTHSVCTLEFNMHNELYDWFNERVKSMGCLECEALPRQHEFARLEMTNIVVSKRKLKRLVDGGYVDGWDDPRMPTLSGMRRRGYPASSLRRLCELIGVTKVPTAVIEFNLLEACVRDACKEETNAKLLCVLQPLRVTVTNYDSAADEIIEVPADAEGLPLRKLPFGRELLLDREDFMEVPEPGFKRLTLGGRAKLRYGYVITCDEVVKDEHGEVVELRCSYDPESLGKPPPKKVAPVHWAHATSSVPIRARLYDRLFSEPRPEEREDFMDALNSKSLAVMDARCEPCVTELCGPDLLGNDKESPLVQFERCGYFALDRLESERSVQSGGPLVFNRTVTIKEAWKPAGKKSPRRR